MVTEADWDHWNPADLKPYIEITLEAFGPERCMFGSDWPVCELAGSYQDVHNALGETIGSLSETELANIFGETANRFYRLGL
jgi:L-fuconolactonase